MNLRRRSTAGIRQPALLGIVSIESSRFGCFGSGVPRRPLHHQSDIDVLHNPQNADPFGVTSLEPRRVLFENARSASACLKLTGRWLFATRVDKYLAILVRPGHLLMWM
jgi:hypothetical protein